MTSVDDFGFAASTDASDEEGDDVELKYDPLQQTDNLSVKTEVEEYPDATDNDADHFRSCDKNDLFADIESHQNRKRQLRFEDYDDDDSDMDWKPKKRKSASSKRKKNTQAKPLSGKRTRNVDKPKRATSKLKVNAKLPAYESVDAEHEGPESRQQPPRRKNIKKPRMNEVWQLARTKWRENGGKVKEKCQEVDDESQEKVTDNQAHPKSGGRRTKKVATEEEEKNETSVVTKPKSSRKKLSEMTLEEREAKKQQWREEARLRRQHRRDHMTPEEREAYLTKERERTRAKRAAKKLDPALREEINRKDRERKILNRALMTPEKREEVNQRQAMRRLMKKMNMTEEEREQLKQAQCLRKIAQLAEKTQEEIEAETKSRRERARFRWAVMPEERRRRIVEKVKQRRLAKLLAMGVTPAGKKGRRMPPNETEEERETRRKHQRREGQRRTTLRRKIAMEKLLDSGVPPEQLFDPEQRRRALTKNRIKCAKTRLKKRLEGSGVPPEEIQAELEKIERTYQGTREFKAYQPRAERVQNRVDPEEYRKLKEQVETNPHPLSKYASLAANPTLVIDSKQEVAAIFSSMSNKLPPAPVAAPPPITTIKSAPSSVPSPVEVSSCSYMPTSGMTEETIPVTSIQIQCYFQPPVYSQPSTLIMQQQQQPSQQTQACSLQHVLDAVNFQEAVDASANMPTTTAMSFNIFPQVPPTYQTSSYQDSCCSIDGDSTYSPGHSTLSPNNETQPVVPTSSQYTPQNDFHSSKKARKWAAQRGVPRGPTKRTDLSTAIPCDICGLMYKKDYMKDHKQRMHNPHFQNGTCLLCGEKIRKSRDFMSHYRVVHQGAVPGRNRGGPRGPRRTPAEDAELGVKRDAICEMCGNAYAREYLNEHKESVHNPHYKDSKCNLCNLPFKTVKLFVQHYRKIHRIKADHIPEYDDERPHICEMCPRSYKTHQDLLRHRRLQHTNRPKEMKKCPYCPGEKMLAASSYHSHCLNMHPEYKSKYIQKCGRCDKQFERESELVDHIKMDHGGAHFPCQFCNSVSYTKIGLFYHYVKCQNCPKKKVHELMEAEGPNEFFIVKVKIPCEICGTRMIISSLSRHYQDIHGVKEDKEFDCWRCDRKFVRRDRWIVHMIDYHDFQWGQELEDACHKLSVQSREGLHIRNENGVNKNTIKYLERVKNSPDAKKKPHSRKSKGSKKKPQDRKKSLPKVKLLPEEESSEEFEELKYDVDADMASFTVDGSERNQEAHRDRIPTGRYGTRSATKWSRLKRDEDDPAVMNTGCEGEDVVIKDEVDSYSEDEEVDIKPF